MRDKENAIPHLISVSELRCQAPQILKKLNGFKEKMYITVNGRLAAALLPINKSSDPDNSSGNKNFKKDI